MSEKRNKPSNASEPIEEIRVKGMSAEAGGRDARESNG
jgi:hypothetical protein